MKQKIPEPVAVTPNFYRLGTPAFPAFLSLGKVGMIIEGGTGPTTEMIIRQIQSLGVDMEKIEYILLTHTHFDHIIGLSDLKSLFGHDLPIYASAKATAQLGSAGEAVHHQMVRSLSLGQDLENLFIGALTNLPEADYLLFDDLLFDDLLLDDLLLDDLLFDGASASESAAGGLSAEAAPQVLPDTPLTAYPTPGHSPASICFYLENTEGGILFSGDTLFRGSVGRTDLPGGNGRALLHSIKTQLMSLPEKTAVYPGHGEPTTLAYEKAHNPFIERS